jgi:hypothetical protein
VENKLDMESRVKRATFIILASVMCLNLQGCSKYQPIYNIFHQDLPLLPNTLTEQEIGNIIIEAAKNRGWSCIQKEPNKIICKHKAGRHHATIEISFTQHDFSIKHINAGHLDAGKDQVHRRYNTWIKMLENTIFEKFEKHILLKKK